MTSKALARWQAGRSVELDRIAEAHTALGGTGVGRRYTTQQVNQAYVTLLSSHFQGFCRDLHSEAVAAMVAPIRPPGLRSVVQRDLTRDRKLDKGNPNPGNLGNDFGRLGVELWPRVRRASKHTASRQQKLEDLNVWRNAIAHQDFTDPRLGGETALRLERLRSWRSACRGLARDFDRVLADHIEDLAGTRPW